MDQCRANCKDNNLDIWFECDCPLDRAKCAAKCTHMYDEKNAVPHNHIIKEKEVVMYHSPLSHLHAHLHKQSAALHKIMHALDINTKMNENQNAILAQHGNLINKQIAMQGKDAERDLVHNEAHRRGAEQRNRIEKKVGDNHHVLHHIDDDTHWIRGKVPGLFNEHNMTQGAVAQVQDRVDSNGNKLDAALGGQGVIMGKVDKVQATLEEHDAHHRAHDAKQDGLIAAHRAHDAKQDGLIAAHAAHDAKQDGLIADHAATQAILVEHKKDAAAHAHRMDHFAADQRAQNAEADEHHAQVSHHMAHENAHMAKEKAHMYKQNKFMKYVKAHVPSDPHVVVVDRVPVVQHIPVVEHAHIVHDHGHGHRLSHGHGHKYNHGHAHKKHGKGHSHYGHYHPHYVAHDHKNHHGHHHHHEAPEAVVVAVPKNPELLVGSSPSS